MCRLRVAVGAEQKPEEEADDEVGRRLLESGRGAGELAQGGGRHAGGMSTKSIRENVKKAVHAAHRLAARRYSTGRLGGGLSAGRSSTSRVSPRGPALHLTYGQWLRRGEIDKNTSNVLCVPCAVKSN
jgi:hypothetical protein